DFKRIQILRLNQNNNSLTYLTNYIRIIAAGRNAACHNALLSLTVKQVHNFLARNCRLQISTLNCSCQEFLSVKTLESFGKAYFLFSYSIKISFSHFWRLRLSVVTPSILNN